MYKASSESCGSRVEEEEEAVDLNDLIQLIAGTRYNPIKQLVDALKAFLFTTYSLFISAALQANYRFNAATAAVLSLPTTAVEIHRLLERWGCSAG